MNKYQEALNNVIETYQELERRVGNNPDKVKDFDDIATLQELVDKETPMKPLTKTRFDEESKVYLSISSCKRCSCYVRRFQLYCEECGQKLEEDLKGWID